MLARRYRSVSFDDIIGQESIAQTLKNAIESGRTAHAYFFTGTRGVGKTSMARIFAHSLNMSADLVESEEIANSIMQGIDLDVIEIDGASNRGVQEARDLIASAGLSPSRCEYRIYIIDEVHMLTTPAFNALLKTMEEPPDHVKFILCTTEPHKVPQTIQSRCQRFDFKTIPSEKISSHLKFIAQEEGVDIEPEVFSEVARLGNGSMRDAISILDRLISASSGSLTALDMEQILGSPPKALVASLCQAIVGFSLKEAFESSSRLIGSGVPLNRILEILANEFRNALIIKVCGKDTELLELSDQQLKNATSISSQFDQAVLTYMIALCDMSSRQVKRGGSGRALFDATIARLCMTEELVEATEVLSGESTTKKKRVKIDSTPELPAEKADVTVELSWEVIKQKLANTAGLKRVASMLEFKSMSDRQLVLSISSSGQDTAHFILSMRDAVEQAVNELSKNKISVQICSDFANPQKKPPDSPLDVIEGNELVDTARRLFEGTVVNVKSLEGD